MIIENRGKDIFQSEAALFKALAHPTRLAILDVLLNGEACVCHLEATLNVRQAYISQQLMVLRSAGLIEDHRDSAYVFYSIKQEFLPVVLSATSSLLGYSFKDKEHLKPEQCSCPKCTGTDKKAGC